MCKEQYETRKKIGRYPCNNRSCRIQSILKCTMEFRLHINLSKKKILTIQITLFTIHLIIINIFIDVTSRLIYGIYYIILCAHIYIYTFFHNGNKYKRNKLS